LSQVQTGKLAHDQAVNKSYGTLQSALASATTQTSVNSAYVTHYQACLASALANGCGTEPFVTALKTLGARA